MTNKTTFTVSDVAKMRYLALDKFHQAIRLREEAERELAAVANLATALAQAEAPKAPDADQ